MPHAAPGLRQLSDSALLTCTWHECTSGLRGLHVVAAAAVGSVTWPILLRLLPFEHAWSTA
jgi:hypothetical protein